MKYILLVLLSVICNFATMSLVGMDDQKKNAAVYQATSGTQQQQARHCGCCYVGDCCHINCEELQQKLIAVGGLQAETLKNCACCCKLVCCCVPCCGLVFSFDPNPLYLPNSFSDWCSSFCCSCCSYKCEKFCEDLPSTVDHCCNSRKIFKSDATCCGYECIGNGLIYKMAQFCALFCWGKQE